MKLLHCICLFLGVVVLSYGQSNTSIFNNYNVKKKRLLIKATGMYIHSINQGVIDMDSAMVLACNANRVPISFSYDEGYNDGRYFPEAKMVDQNNIDEAVKRLNQLEKKDRIKLLLHIASHYLFKTGEKKVDTQKAFMYIKQAKELSISIGISKWKWQSDLLLAKYYSQINNLVESKKLFSKVVNETRRVNDKKALAEALNNQGTYLLLGEPDKVKILSEAMLLYKSINEKELEIEMLMKMLTVHFWNGDTNLAEKQLLESYELQKKNGFKHIHYTSAPLSYIYTSKLNLNKALFYSIKSLESMNLTNDMICADSFYLRLGSTYDSMGHSEEAIELYKKSFDFGTKNLNSGSWFKSFPLIIQSLLKENRYDEALKYIEKTNDYPPKNELDIFFLSQTKASYYEKIGNLLVAEKFYIEMEKHAKDIISLRTATSVANGYSDISLFYAKNGNPVKAKYYANKVSDLSVKMKQKFNFSNLKLSLFKIDSIEGNYLSSIRHYQSYNRINDSLYNQSKNRQIEELKIQYETLMKEDDIKTLEMQSKLQQSKLDRSKLFINLSTGSIILLIIIIILLFNRYLLKQKNNKKLEIKEKQIGQKNLNLQHLLAEKEWLIREIHHRVKNNLQTVISLLNSQSAYVEDDLALSTIKNSQHRIHAMSLIHQKLYMSENISTISMPIYVKELAEYLKDSFNLKQRIRFKIKIDELKLDVSQAVPLGLIINEAVTNSIKYAFPDNQSGMISITLTAVDINHYLLTIQDDGVGIDINSNKKVSASFGMSLIKGLSDDLDGDFSIEINNGTLLKLYFEKNVIDKQKISYDKFISG